MIIDESTVEHVARLARIELTADECIRLGSDLEKILKSFEELSQVNTDGVAPFVSPAYEMQRSQETSESQDHQRNASNQKEILGNAAKTKAGQFLVDAVIEGES